MAENQEYKAKELVSYQSDVITVRNPGAANVVVYAHPKEKILFEFDINSLNKELVNGDLVIHTYSGGSITIANFAIMTMEDDNPKITDILENEYNGQDLFKDTVPFITDDDPTPYVISRTKSSPKSLDTEGEYLSTADASEKAEDSAAKYTGNTPIDQQSPVSSVSAMVQPYAIRTLLFPTDKKYDVDVNFTYNGRTVFNQEQPNKKTTPVLEQPPEVNPRYGTFSYVVQNQDQTGLDKYYVVNGGGQAEGIDNAYLMYTAETIDIGNLNNNEPVEYFGTLNQVMKRSMSVSLPMPNVSIEVMRLTGIREGIRLLDNSSVTVQRSGADSYVIKPKTLDATLVIDFEYDGAKMPEFKSNMNLSVEGFNSKYNKVVHGSTNFKFEVKDVYSDADISSGYKTYTYGRQIDPLNVFGTEGSDVFHGGIASNHVFHTKGGNDTFESGTGNEEIYLDDGDDTFIYSEGADRVDGGVGFDTISFKESVNLDKDNLTVVFNTGGELLFQFKGVSAEKNPKMKHFESLQLDASINHIVVNSTIGFADNELIITGNNYPEVSDILEFKNASTIDLIEYRDQNLGVFATAGGVKIKFQQNEQDVGAWKYLGSNSNDVFKTTGLVAIDFDAKNGRDEVEYYQDAVTYYASNQTATINKIIDNLLSIESLIGSIGDDVFYGSLDSNSMSYQNNRLGEADGDKLDYNFSTESGSSTKLTLDYRKIVQDQTITIKKGSSGNIDTVTGIKNEVYASKNDDTFILDGSTALTIHGEDGLNTVQMENSSAVTFTIDSGDYTVATSMATIKLDKIQRFEGGTSTNLFAIANFRYPTLSHSFIGNNSIDTLDYTNYAAEGLDISITNITSLGGAEGTSKRAHGGDFVLDTFKNINIINGSSDQEDKFELKNVSWGDFADQEMVVDGVNQINLSEVNSRGNEFIYSNTVAANVFAEDFENTLLNIQSVTMAGTGAITLFVKDQQVENIQHYYSSNASSTLSALYARVGITAEIDQGSKSAQVDFTSYQLSAFNFTRFEGTSEGDTFNITATVDDTYVFAGNESEDTLDYSNTAIKLNVDLAASKIYKDETWNSDKIDSFSGIENIIGGLGNDTFKIDPNTAYNIDGGDGNNLVSFENFPSPLTSINFTLYKNIQGYILTEFADIIALDDADLVNKSTEKRSINAVNSAGVADTLALFSLTSPVSLRIDKDIHESMDYENTYLQVARQNDGYHAFTSFEQIKLNSYGTTITSNTIDLSNVATKLNNWHTLGFTSGSDAVQANNELDLTAVSDQLIIRFNEILPNIDDSEIYVSVSNDAKLSRFMLNAEFTKTIQLGTNTDGNKLDITETTVIPANMTIDLGDGNKDVLSFSTVTSAVNVAFTSTGVEVTMNGDVQSYDVLGYEGIEGGGANDIFTVFDNINHLPTIAINGAAGNANKVIFEHASAVTDSLLTVDLTEKTTDATATINGSGGATILTANIKNIQIYDAKTFDSVFNSSDDSKNVNTFIGNMTNSTLAYKGDQSQTMTFNIGYDAATGYNGTAVRLTGTADQFSKMTTLTGRTEKSSNFVINETILNALSTNTLTIKGGSGEGATNVLRFTGAFSTGLTFDLTENTILSAGSVIVKTFHIDTFTGTTGNDVFTVSDTYINEGGGLLNGNKGGDTIDLRSVSTAGTVDVAKGYISYGSGDAQSKITYKSMETAGSNDGTIIAGSAGLTVVMSNLVNGGISLFDLSASTDTTKNILSYEYKQTALIDFKPDETTSGLDGISITDGSFGSYILTNFADTVQMDATKMNNISLNAGKGGSGADQITYTSDDLTLTLDNINLQTVETSGNIIHNLSRFETFVFEESSVNTITISDYTTALTFKNIPQVYKSGSNTFQYEGSTDIDNVFNLTIDLTSGSVTKLNPELARKVVDNITGINAITTTNNVNDTVYLSVDLLTNSDITLDGGDDENEDVLSLAKVEIGGSDHAKITDAEVIFSNNIANKYNFSGFNKIIGSNVNDYFKLDSLDGDIKSIFGGAVATFDPSSVGSWSGTPTNIQKAGNILDFSSYQANADIIINVKSGSINITEGDFSFNNINTFVGSENTKNIFRGLGGGKSYVFVGGSSSEDTVSYNGGSTPITLTITANGASAGADVLQKIEVIGLTDRNDTFIFEEYNSDVNLSGEEGRDVAKLIANNQAVSINATSGFTVDNNSIKLSSVEAYYINTSNNSNITLTAGASAETDLLLKQTIVSADENGNENSVATGTLNLDISNRTIDIKEKLNILGTTIGYTFKFNNMGTGDAISNSYSYFNAYSLNANGSDVNLTLTTYNFTNPTNIISISNASARSSVSIAKVENLSNITFNDKGVVLGSAPILAGATTYKLVGNTTAINLDLNDLVGSYNFALDQLINIKVADGFTMSYDPTFGGISFSSGSNSLNLTLKDITSSTVDVSGSTIPIALATSSNIRYFQKVISDGEGILDLSAFGGNAITLDLTEHNATATGVMKISTGISDTDFIGFKQVTLGNKADTVKIDFQLTNLRLNGGYIDGGTQTSYLNNDTLELSNLFAAEGTISYLTGGAAKQIYWNGMTGGQPSWTEDIYHTDIAVLMSVITGASVSYNNIQHQGFENLDIQLPVTSLAPKGRGAAFVGIDSTNKWQNVKVTGNNWGYVVSDSITSFTGTIALKDRGFTLDANVATSSDSWRSASTSSANALIFTNSSPIDVALSFSGTMGTLGRSVIVNYSGNLDFSRLENAYNDSASTLCDTRFNNYMGGGDQVSYGLLLNGQLSILNQNQITENIEIKIGAGGWFINPAWKYDDVKSLSTQMTFSADRYNDLDVHYKNYISIFDISDINLFQEDSNGFKSVIDTTTNVKYTLQNIEGYLLQNNDNLATVFIHSIVDSSNIIIKSNANYRENDVFGADREFTHRKVFNTTYDFSNIDPDVGKKYLFTFDEIESDLVKSANTPKFDSYTIKQGTVQYKTILGNMAAANVANGIDSVYGTDGTANINAGLGYSVLAFTNMENAGRIMDNVEGATNADRGVETYYGMSGVKNLIGTKGDDTFSWGRGFMVEGLSQHVIVGAFWNTRNTMWDGGSVDMGEGNDTYLFQLTTSGAGADIVNGAVLTTNNMRIGIQGVDNTNSIEETPIKGVENLILDDYSFDHAKLPGYDRLYDGTKTILTVDASMIQDSINHVLDMGGGIKTGFNHNGIYYTKMDNQIFLDLSTFDEFVPIQNKVTESGVLSATAYQIGSVTAYNAMEWQFKNYEGDGIYTPLTGNTDRGQCLDWSNRHLDPLAYDRTVSFFALQQSSKPQKNLEFYADVGVNYILKSTPVKSSSNTVILEFEFVDFNQDRMNKTFIMVVRVDDLGAGNNMYFAVRDPGHLANDSWDIAWFSVKNIIDGALTPFSSDSDDYAARALNMEDEKITKDDSSEESKDNNTKDESTEPDIDFTGNGKMEADFFGHGSSNKGNANNTSPDTTPDNEVGVNEENSNFESHSAHSSAPSKSVNNNTQDDVKPLTSASHLDLNFKLEEAELDLSNLMQVIEEESNIDLNQLDAINEDIDNLPENLLELTNTIDASDSMSYALADSSSSLEDSHQDSLVAHEPKHKLHS